MNDQPTNGTTPNGSPPSPAAPCSAEPYVAAKCLREEVERFKRTNRFTPMEVTGFYIQAAVVLDERATLINAAEWLALEVSRHGDKCTCGSCHAVAACADMIESKNSKYIAQTIRRQLLSKNPPND